MIDLSLDHLRGFLLDMGSPFGSNGNADYTSLTHRSGLFGPLTASNDTQHPSTPIKRQTGQSNTLTPSAEPVGRVHFWDEPPLPPVTGYLGVYSISYRFG
jgi:hypothetical protein